MIDRESGHSGCGVVVTNWGARTDNLGLRKEGNLMVCFVREWGTVIGSHSLEARHPIGVELSVKRGRKRILETKRREILDVEVREDVCSWVI